MRYILFFLGYYISGFLVFSQSSQEGILATSGDEVIKEQVQIVWILGDTFVGNLESESASLTQGGAYYTQAALLTSTTRIHLPELKIYPNPGSEYIWVEGVPSEKAWALKLYTLHGQMLMNHPLMPFSTNEISLKGLPSGVFLIHIENQSGLFQPFRFLKR